LRRACSPQQATGSSSSAELLGTIVVNLSRLGDAILTEQAAVGMATGRRRA
jgi:hypothetical protein